MERIYSQCWRKSRENVYEEIKQNNDDEEVEEEDEEMASWLQKRINIQQISLGVRRRGQRPGQILLSSPFPLSDVYKSGHKGGVCVIGGVSVCGGVGGSGVFGVGVGGGGVGVIDGGSVGVSHVGGGGVSGGVVHGGGVNGGVSGVDGGGGNGSGYVVVIRCWCQ